MKCMHVSETEWKLIHGEIIIHKKVCHPCIVQYLGEVMEKDCAYIFVEGTEYVSVNWFCFT